VKARVKIPTALLIAGLLALTGCVAVPGDSAPTAPADSANLLAEHSLDGLDARQIIDRLDVLPIAERPAELFASIRPDSLIVSDGAGREVSLPMPDAEFYVSVAPYATQTHDCYFHSLTTCLGELQNQDVHVTIADADGSVLVDDIYRTFSNGFLGFWLPRDITATITLEYNGLTVTAPISTSGEDPTCVTTLQLT
jgi:hypothetical protein